MIQRTGMLRLSGRIRARYLRGVIYTVGHSTRSLEALVALLTAYRVGLVVDVRRYPASRRHPHFAEHALAAALHAAGIGYRHEPDLGGRRRARRDSPTRRGAAPHSAATRITWRPPRSSKPSRG